MKKFFSLFMVVAIVFSLGLTAFAETNGLETIYTRNGNEITVDIYVNDMSNVTEFAHFLNLKKTQVLIVEDSVVTNETVFAGWDFSSGSTDKVTFTQGTSKITLKINSSAKTIAVTDKVLLASYKITVVEGEELTEESFAYDTSNSKLKSCYVNIGTTATFLNGTYKYVVSGGNTGWTETDGETTVTVKFPTSATEKAGAESSWTGNASTQASKKAVKFGKNETGAKMLGATVENGKLVVNNADYFVEYDGKKYYGLIDVEAGKSWAILIIESVSAN